MVLMGIVAVTISVPGYFLIRFVSRRSLVAIAIAWLGLIVFLVITNAWVQAYGMAEYKERPEPGLLMSLDVYEAILAFGAILLTVVSGRFALLAFRQPKEPLS